MTFESPDDNPHHAALLASPGAQPCLGSRLAWRRFRQTFIGSVGVHTCRSLRPRLSKYVRYLWDSTLADHEGHVVEGDYVINQAGFVPHGAAHKMHPDIVAMCHAHTEYGTTFASLGKPLAPIKKKRGSTHSMGLP